MDIESTRFGTFQVREDLVLTFSEGLIGLPGQRYALVAKDEGSPFYWLHSAEHADVAVPVTNPWLFFSDYEVRVSDEDAEELGLAAPVIIHRANRLGRQIINDAGGYSVRHHLFSEVELNEARAMAAGSTPAEATAV
jgi:flagellar assembly factor FliW